MLGLTVVPRFRPAQTIRRNKSALLKKAFRSRPVLVLSVSAVILLAVVWHFASEGVMYNDYVKPTQSHLPRWKKRARAVHAATQRLNRRIRTIRNHARTLDDDFLMDVEENPGPRGQGGQRPAQRGGKKKAARDGAIDEIAKLKAELDAEKKARKEDELRRNSPLEKLKDQIAFIEIDQRRKQAELQAFNDDNSVTFPDFTGVVPPPPPIELNYKGPKVPGLFIADLPPSVILTGGHRPYKWKEWLLMSIIIVALGLFIIDFLLVMHFQSFIGDKVFYATTTAGAQMFLGGFQKRVYLSQKPDFVVGGVYQTANGTTIYNQTNYAADISFARNLYSIVVYPAIIALVAVFLMSYKQLSCKLVGIQVNTNEVIPDDRPEFDRGDKLAPQMFADYKLYVEVQYGGSFLYYSHRSDVQLPDFWYEKQGSDPQLRTLHLNVGLMASALNRKTLGLQHKSRDAARIDRAFRLVSNNSAYQEDYERALSSGQSSYSDMQLYAGTFLSGNAMVNPLDFC